MFLIIIHVSLPFNGSSFCKQISRIRGSLLIATPLGFQYTRRLPTSVLSDMHPNGKSAPSPFALTYWRSLSCDADSWQVLSFSIWFSQTFPTPDKTKVVLFSLPKIRF